MAVFESKEIQYDGVDGCQQECDVGAIVFRSVHPSDFIAANVFGRNSFGFRIIRFQTDSLTVDKNARLVHGDDGSVNKFRSLFAHEIINDANAVLFQITDHTLTRIYKPLHVVVFRLTR